MSNHNLSLVYKAQVRTDRAVYKKFKAQVVGLEGSALRFDEGVPNLENVMTALFHWFSRLPGDQAEAFLVLEFRELEEFMRRPRRKMDWAAEPPEPDDENEERKAE